MPPLWPMFTPSTTAASSPFTRRRTLTRYRTKARTQRGADAGSSSVLVGHADNELR
jgi:hypothetical protein